MDNHLIKHEISEVLQSYRAHKDLQVADMVEKSTIKRGTFVTYLYGNITPSIANLIKICNKFELPINGIFSKLIEWPTEQDDIARITACFNSQDPKVEIRQKRLYQIIHPLIKSNCDEVPRLTKAGFGKRLRVLREDLRLTRTSMANSFGVSPNTLKQYESNQYLPGVPIMLDICSALSVSPEYMLARYLTYSFPVDKRFYLLTPRQLKAFAETAERLYNFDGF